MKVLDGLPGEMQYVLLPMVGFSLFTLFTYPLTAPATSPLARLRWTSAKKTKDGIVNSTDAAMSGFHSTVNLPKKDVRPTGMVLSSSRFMNVIANINSFHAPMNAKIADATIPCSERGNTILVKAPSLEHPSISAASSSSRGISSKKPFNIHTVSGSVNVV